MITSTFSAGTIGWVPIATGITGLLGLASIILFFTIGQPFGTLNDIAVAVAAILSAALAWILYPTHHAQSPQLSLFALVAAVVGAAVVVVGSVLVVSGRTGWFLAGLYMTAGNALIGLWLLGLAYSALRGSAWPQGLVVLGVVAGAVMVPGLLSVPGILRGIDAQGLAPWYVNAGYVGALGWLLLYPLWCIWLGRFLLRQ